MADNFIFPVFEVCQFIRTIPKMFLWQVLEKEVTASTLTQTKLTIATMPPDPCATRRNSWYFVVQYHADNFTLYKRFIDSALVVCGNSSTHHAYSEQYTLM
jgi:hypothetical protein